MFGLDFLSFSLIYFMFNRSFFSFLSEVFLLL